ncbi:hypothetical protein EVAR_73989_1 [Eumeta japonica]|uniref:Uncharacterized protein n=1 Tax=Eumeta variegata TaxID=151549 RepID=A0A4C1T8X3_EUMVA|nr:hypothetical protein EVAR_73989_1 [Eumeta japonica]
MRSCIRLQFSSFNLLTGGVVRARNVQTNRGRSSLTSSAALRHPRHATAVRCATDRLPRIRRFNIHTFCDDDHD